MVLFIGGGHAMVHTNIHMKTGRTTAEEEMCPH